MTTTTQGPKVLGRLTSAELDAAEAANGDQKLLSRDAFKLAQKLRDGAAEGVEKERLLIVTHLPRVAAYFEGKVGVTAEDFQKYVDAALNAIHPDAGTGRGQFTPEGLRTLNRQKDLMPALMYQFGVDEWNIDTAAVLLRAAQVRCARRLESGNVLDAGVYGDGTPGACDATSGTGKVCGEQFVPTFEVFQVGSREVTAGNYVVINGVKHLRCHQHRAMLKKLAQENDKKVFFMTSEGADAFIARSNGRQERQSDFEAGVSADLDAIGGGRRNERGGFRNGGGRRSEYEPQTKRFTRREVVNRGDGWQHERGGDDE
jgi:hypothetical protein